MSQPNTKPISLYLVASAFLILKENNRSKIAFEATLRNILGKYFSWKEEKMVDQIIEEISPLISKDYAGGWNACRTLILKRLEKNETEA